MYPGGPRSAPPLAAPNALARAHNETGPTEKGASRAANGAPDVPPVADLVSIRIITGAGALSWRDCAAQGL